MVINNYEIIGELHNDKSGYAKWGFAKKNGNEYFIKEFLSPIYPIDEEELSQELLERRRNICNDFSRKKKEFYLALNKCITGNIVTIIDFFRFKSKYYIVTEKVISESLSIDEISRLNDEQKLLIIKVVLHCVSVLHEHHIVHGDIKPDNILLKKTKKGMYTAKIIDFDSGFLESCAPSEDEELQGDMVYLAPEAFLYMIGEGKKLTGKIDIFALGVLFHQYFCGSVPEYKNEYDYLFEAVLNDAEIKIGKEVPESVIPILRSMLDKDPDKRPEAKEILAYLQKGSLPSDDEAVNITENNRETENSNLLKSTMRSRNDTNTSGSGGAFFRKAGELL